MSNVPYLKPALGQNIVALHALPTSNLFFLSNLYRSLHFPLLNELFKVLENYQTSNVTVSEYFLSEGRAAFVVVVVAVVVVFP